MADFNAKINLDADNSKALRKIQQVERAVNRIDAEVNKLGEALEKIESRALSRLPRSLQMVVAYLKAANTGMGQFAQRAITAASAVGSIGKVSLAPIVKAQTQAISKFDDMGGALVRVNNQIIRLRENINSLIGPIEQVSVKFLNPKNFSPKLPGNIGFGGGAGTQYYNGAIGPNPQAALPFRYNQRQLPPSRQTDLDKALQSLGLFDAALKKAVTQVNQFGRGGTLQQGPKPAFNLGSIRALEAQQRAQQALVDNAVIGTRAFNNYSRALNRTTQQLDRARTSGQGFFQQLSNPQSRLGAAVIGGGFPLITGGGPGSVLGGALGGLAGGFAGSIGGSAIGQLADQFGAAAIKTGKALNSLTLDITEISKAAGLTGTAFERQLQTIEEVVGAQRAQEVAAAQLAVTIGTDGVAALERFGEAGQQLENELARIATALAVMFAGLAPLAENIAQNIKEQRQLSRVDPGIAGFGRGDLADREDVQLARDRFAVGSRTELQTRQELLRIVQEIEAAEQATADAARGRIDIDRERIALANINLELSRLKGGLLNDEVVELRLQKLELQAIEKINQNLLDLAAKRITRQQAITRQYAIERQLEADRNNLLKDRDKAVTSAADSAPQSRILQLEQQILQEKQKQQDLDVRFEELTAGRIAATQLELKNLSERFARESQIIDLQKQQALETNKVPEDAAKIVELAEARKSTLRDILGLKQIELQQLEAQLTLQRELTRLEDERAKAASLGALDQSIAQQQLQLANPFGGDDYERRALALQQEYELTTRMQKEQEKLADLEARRNAEVIGSERFKDAQGAVERQEKYITDLKERLTLEQALETQLLNQKLVLEKITPVTDALAAGMADIFTSLIDGSKSAEEAFADMLRNMGQALIQTGTQMIAQYIAIGIARAFAGMGGGGSLFGGSTLGSYGGDFTGAFMSGAGLRASGGPVQGNQPYIVGERGPELFLPHQSGYVQSNTATRASLPSSNQPRTIRFETTMINNVEYVTKEEAIMIGQQAADDGARRGAKMGQTQTLNGLRNSRSQRSKIGMR